jgi:small subunit ribosomal protein S5
MPPAKLDLNSKYKNMQEEIINNNETVSAPVATEPTPIAVIDSVAVAVDKPSDKRYVRREGGQGGQSANRGGFKGGRGGRPARPPREKPEFDSKAIDVRRVTRVVSGGRRFSLHVTMIAGDRNGRVGLGTGKATDTQAAMDKALKSAKKNMIRFKMDNKKSIAHEVRAKYDTSEVWISPNKEKGLIAGSAARVILNLAGLANVTAKFHGGTKNKLNNARATMKALSEVSERA